ncbi:Ribokinase-like protein [Pavlovales sp. CCMP2436]|nr:Ribokinase-like protein [Pavlovales sp. CCMP2436]
MVGSTLGLALAMVPALTVTVWRLRRLRHMLPTACASEPPTVSVAQAEEAEKAAAAHVVRLWPRAHSPPRHDGAEPAVSGVIGGGGLSRERVRSAVHLLQAVETTDELRASLGRNASRTPDCTAPLVLVLGSINMDLHAETDGFPGVGSNTKGRFFNSPGGKGANEAVGLAQLGCRSVLIGRLGTDPMGDLLLAQLPAWRVDVSAVVRDPDNSTGVAVIVESAREKHKLTISCQGANSAVGAPELESLRLRLPNASAVVLQLEVCRQSVVAAAQLAAQAGKLVVLKASPCAAAADAPAALLRHVDVLFANDLEAGVLIGAQAPLRVLADGARAAEELRASGIGAVVLTTPVAHIVACSGALDLQLGQLRQLGGGGAEAVAEADAPATNEGAAGGEAHGGRRVRSLSEGGEPLAPPQLNGANGVGGGRARLLVVPMFRVDMGSGSVIGAADAFVAAFVASLVRGMPLETV